MSVEMRNITLVKLKKVILELLQASPNRGILPMPEINFETDIIDDLGLDSIEVMDLASGISIEFGVSSDAEMSKIKKVDDIVSFILSKSGK